MNYQLTRSKRRTISIRITKDGVIDVRAPIKMPVSEIESFIDSKKRWISKHQQEALEKSSARQCFELNYYDTVVLRGNNFIIEPSEEKNAFIDIDNSKSIFIPKGYTSQQILDSVRNMLIKYAKSYIPQQTENFAKLMDVTPSSVKIGNANTRWGSCSSQGRINFSWKLVMCSDEVIDYIIVHELSHLTHMNHSRFFWEEVEKFAPLHKESRAKLKAFNRQLSSESW